jgi:hypothetical protein
MFLDIQLNLENSNVLLKIIYTINNNYQAKWLV